MEILNKTEYLDHDGGREYEIEITVLRLDPDELREYALNHQRVLESEWAWDYESHDAWEKVEKEKARRMRAWENRIAETLGYEWRSPETSKDVENLTEGLSITQSMAEFFTVVWTKHRPPLEEPLTKDEEVTWERLIAALKAANMTPEYVSEKLKEASDNAGH